MKKRPGKGSRGRRGPDRAEHPKHDRAWDAADWRYAGLAAASMFPLLGPKLSPEDVIRELREILRACPAYYPALFHLGTLEAAAGRGDEARRLLLEGADRMAEREPSPDEDQVSAVDGIIGPLEEGLLRYDLARDLLERLSDRYPSEAEYRSDLGAALVFLGARDEAIQRFEESVALAPENHRYHSNLGWGCLEVGRLADAKAHLERALALAPDDPVALGNYSLLPILEEGGGSFEDYLLRPLDHEEIERLEAECDDTGDFEELDRAVNQWNYDRLEAWKREICRRRDQSNDLELYKSVRAFFQFLKQLSQDTYTLYEDIELLDLRFERVMHAFILRMSDADQEIIEEVCAGLLSFYGYLARKGVIGRRAFAELRSTIHRMKPGLVEKADRYAQIRQDDSLPGDEKERIRDQLFDTA